MYSLISFFFFFFFFVFFWPPLQHMEVSWFGVKSEPPLLPHPLWPWHSWDLTHPCHLDITPPPPPAWEGLLLKLWAMCTLGRGAEGPSGLTPGFCSLGCSSCILCWAVAPAGPPSGRPHASFPWGCWKLKCPPGFSQDHGPPEQALTPPWALAWCSSTCQTSGWDTEVLKGGLVTWPSPFLCASVSSSAKWVNDGPIS